MQAPLAPQDFRASRRLMASWAAAFALLSGVACGGGQGDGSGHNDIGTAPVPTATTSPSCEVPNEGCPCSTEGESVTCPGPTIHNGAYTTCLTGARVCSQGVWGPCISPTVY